MTRRFTYQTTLAFSTGDVPEADEVEIEVSFTVAWGSPETPPTYSHGGLPADPDEVNDITLLSVDGVGGPFDQHDEAAILQTLAMNHTEAMLNEASEIEGDREDEARERQYESRREMAREPDGTGEPW